MSAESVAIPVTGRTKIMFILADPVAHVRGSALFHEHFRRNGLDAVIAPLHVRPEDLGPVVAAIRKMRNVAGFGVTIPHKIEILNHVDSRSERAGRVGAVNFVRRETDGALAGENVDGLGFVAGLKRNGIEPAGLKVLQVGAGGAGRAIAFALAEAGVSEIALANRSIEKARALAAAVQAAYPRCRCRSAAAEATEETRLVVNATSLGMHEGDALPADLARLPPAAAVADVVMMPETTALLAEAAQRGCRIVRGREMLMDQLRLASEFLRL